MVSIAEFGVKPKKLGKLNVIAQFEKVITNVIDVVDIDVKIADIASTLRAINPSLRGMDSLQVASAIKVKVDMFITNEKRLRIIKELKVVLVKDL